MYAVYIVCSQWGVWAHDGEWRAGGSVSSSSYVQPPHQRSHMWVWFCIFRCSMLVVLRSLLCQCFAWTHEWDCNLSACPNMMETERVNLISVLCSTVLTPILRVYGFYLAVFLKMLECVFINSLKLLDRLLERCCHVGTAVILGLC